MENAPKTKKAQALTRVLERIYRGIDPKLLCKEAGHLFPDIGPGDIAVAEQNLINAGYSPRLAQQLSSVFVYMAMLKDQNTSLKFRLIPGHLLHKVMAEHELIRCFLIDLDSTEAEIQQTRHLTDTSSEFCKLGHIVRHLDAMEEHIAREEDVIFPCLQEHGWGGLCRSVRSEHTYVRIAINDLVELVQMFDENKIQEFKARLKSVTAYLCLTMVEHLFEEDNIVYPIALEVVTDNKVWERMKVVCDEIGYCGLHI